MFKYLILILLSISINGEFAKSILLEDVKSIKIIDVSYMDDKGSIQKQSVKIDSVFLEDNIIFSEVKQDMSLGSFILKYSDGVSSLRIEYLDYYGKNRSKLVSIDKGSILNNQLYFYEKGDYFYHNKPNVAVLAKKENLIFEDNLPIVYDDKSTFIDISFKRCNESVDCDYVKFNHWDKRVIFYFKFKTINDKRMNLSANIKRIQIANKTNNEYPTWLIVEAVDKIKKIKRIHKNNGGKIVYRIYLD